VLAAALGRDIEKYDQLCDSIDAQLVSIYCANLKLHSMKMSIQHRAISVLKRDLRREEQRKEEEEKRKAADVATVQPLTEHVLEDTAMQPPDTESAQLNSSPTVRTLPSRRPSTISISSLHRPHPLKLDLSSITLKITEEEAALIKKELGSPVTLAPKSARPFNSNELPDIMAAFSNTPMSTEVHGPPSIDLTIHDNIHMPQERSSLPLGLGDSSDKPIELDLDSMDIEMANMTDLFGDAESADDAAEDLFSPLGQNRGELSENLGGLSTKESVLADFQIDSNMNVEVDPPVPSPGSLLAQFSSSHLMGNKSSPSGNPDLSTASTETFDLSSIDLSNLDPFFTNGQEAPNFSMDMESFMNMSAGGSEKIA